MSEVTNEGAGSPSLETFAPPPVTYSLRLVEITSYLVVSRRGLRSSSGSVEALNGLYRSVLIHNLLFGWWGFPFGLIWTPMALYSNAKARRKLLELSSSGLAAPGWFPDPTGRHGARYWDGQAWTDRVSDVSTDTLPGATAGTNS